MLYPGTSRPDPGDSKSPHSALGGRVKFKKGDTVIYPQHGACIVQGTKKKTMFGETQEYLILRTVINEMTLSVPLDKTEEVGVRPPVSADELEDLVSVLVEARSPGAVELVAVGSRTTRRS